MRTKAIIIKKQNTNEYDQLVTCYTQESGKLTAVAKSILKSDSIQAMHLDIFNLVDFDLIGNRSTPIITGAQVYHTFYGMKSSLYSLAIAYFFSDIVDKMVYDNDKDVALWGFLEELFFDLDKSLNTSLPIIFRTRQLDLLKLLGYFPQLDRCSLCRGRVGYNSGVLSSDISGLICDNCFLSGNRGILIKRDDRLALEGKVIKETNSGRLIIDDIFEFILGKRLKSLDFIFQASKLNIHENN